MRTEGSLRAAVGSQWPGRIENSTVLEVPMAELVGIDMYSLGFACGLS